MPWWWASCKGPHSNQMPCQLFNMQAAFPHELPGMHADCLHQRARRCTQSIKLRVFSTYKCPSLPRSNRPKEQMKWFCYINCLLRVRLTCQVVSSVVQWWNEVFPFVSSMLACSQIFISTCRKSPCMRYCSPVTRVVHFPNSEMKPNCCTLGYILPSVSSLQNYYVKYTQNTNKKSKKKEENKNMMGHNLTWCSENMPS